MKNHNTLYVLEKTWKYEPKLKFDLDSIHQVLIRPCSVSYKTYRNFSLGRNVKCKTIIHEGCVLSWWPNDNCSKTPMHPATKTFEEFMIYANVNERITPLVENWIIMDNYHSIFVKTIDLKTNEVLYDNVENVMKQFNKLYAT